MKECIRLWIKYSKFKLSLGSLQGFVKDMKVIDLEIIKGKISSIK